MKIDKEVENLRHKNKMEEIEFERKARLEVEQFKLDSFKEMQRIKNANIQRTLMRKGYN